jgi:vacuolar-type H+-ATPase subunit F/Vma7
VSTPAEAGTALQQALSLPETGIIIITEMVAGTISDQVQAFRRNHEIPLIVEIPGPEGSLPSHKGLLQLVQEAVGIRISFQEGP